MSGKWISLLCSLCLCVSPGLPCRSQEHAPGNYFADNGYRDAVELIYHPSGHHHQGTTFLAFEGTDRAPHVCSYNHKTRTWVGPVKAGDNLLFATNDGHGRPSIVVDNRGYIHLAYGGHGGHRGLGINPLGTNGHGEQTHVVSMKPMDVTAWRKVENISPFGTYSQFVKSDEGHLYLFFRHGTHKSDWVYQCSTDAGETFGPPVIVLMHRTDRDDPTIHQKWYAFFNKGTKNTVHCCFVLHPCREKPGHNTDRRNVYYMKMSFDQPGLWKNASGDARQAPIEKETADTHALVFDSGDADCRDSSVRADDQDRPHIVFHKSGGGRTHGLVYTRWTDSEWQAHSFTARSCHDHFADLTVNSADNVQVISAAT
ncbi:MAG: BNR-4 repeat-containing protein, partial [Planctomycetaceae bacterium]|nr:BNR-4 repeat-containing protein [Planctomycetaceae bacterium]